MKNKAQKQSNIIVQMLQEMQPCFYSSHLQEKFIILCQSLDGTYISKFLADFFQHSIKYFMNQILPSQQNIAIIDKQYHKRRLANFIISCREQLEQKSIQGSCYFGLAYIFQSYLICLRSDGIEMYLIDEQSQRIWVINNSMSYKCPKRIRNKFIEQAYFSANMQKIKAQYLFQNNQGLKKALHFDYLNLDSFDQSSNLKLLVGCSQTFELISSDFLFKYFKNNSQKSDCEKVNGLLEQGKKKMKSIHHLDLSLLCWKINRKQLDLLK